MDISATTNDLKNFIELLSIHVKDVIATKDVICKIYKIIISYTMIYEQQHFFSDKQNKNF